MTTTHDAVVIQLSTVPGIIFALMNVTILLAGAIAVTRSQLFKTRLDAAEGAVNGLRGDRDDLQRRLDEQRKENDDCSTKYDTLKTHLEAEIKKREALESVITGKKELEAVLAILTASDKRAERMEHVVIDIQSRLPKARSTGASGIPAG